MLSAFLILAIIGASLAVPRDQDCIYDTIHHNVGDTWTTIEGCNQCHCTNSGMVCTTHDCNIKRFAKPNTGTWDCNSEGDWYSWYDFWILKDGCNTCYCKMPGNFRGYQVCTANKCPVDVHVG